MSVVSTKLCFIIFRKSKLFRPTVYRTTLWTYKKFVSLIFFKIRPHFFVLQLQLRFRLCISARSDHDIYVLYPFPAWHVEPFLAQISSATFKPELPKNNCMNQPNSGRCPQGKKGTDFWALESKIERKQEVKKQQSDDRSVSRIPITITTLPPSLPRKSKRGITWEFEATDRPRLLFGIWVCFFRVWFSAPLFMRRAVVGRGILARLSRPSGGKNLQLSVRIKKMSPPLPFSHKGNFFLFSDSKEERKIKCKKTGTVRLKPKLWQGRNAGAVVASLSHK